MSTPEKSHWSDKAVSIPGRFGLETVPAEIVGLWVKMRLVGTESRARVSTLRRRTGWGEKKLRRWQQAAWDAGWIFLLVEGKSSGGRKLQGQPREWWLCWEPFELPTVETLREYVPDLVFPTQPASWHPHISRLKGCHFGNPCKGGHFEGAWKRRGLETAPPTRSLKEPEQETNREKENPAPPSLQATPPPQKNHLEAEGILVRLDRIRQASRYKRPLARTAGNFLAALRARAAYGPDLEAGYRDFLRFDETWLNDRRHPLGSFADNPDIYLPAPARAGSPPPPAPRPADYGESLTDLARRAGVH